MESQHVLFGAWTSICKLSLVEYQLANSLALKSERQKWGRSRRPLWGASLHSRQVVLDYLGRCLRNLLNQP